VRGDLDRLHERLARIEATPGPQEIDPEAWLREMQLSYATAEQRAIHRGASQTRVADSDVTFF
jgi:methyl-accepting chemotaxis protein